MSAGSFLSSALGGNTNTSKRDEGGVTYHKSPTTNSYSKCLDALAGQLTQSVAQSAREMIDPHDQNSFHEKKIIGRVIEEDEGVSVCSKHKVLNVKGTYSFALVAHLKTLEIWVSYEQPSITDTPFPAAGDARRRLLNSMTIEALREECGSRGLSTSGLKSDLVNRLC
jgi:hypothetical protein